ncbi:MAG: 50S ribosomal protein L29 [bacterium]|nr:50S ribosomal protein L29 [bacterium]
MNTSELRRLDDVVLQVRANELLAQIATLGFGAQQKEKNVKKLRELRRERARSLTILTERKRGQT